MEKCKRVFKIVQYESLGITTGSYGACETFIMCRQRRNLNLKSDTFKFKNNTCI